jgi:hypothetical protein
MSGLSGAEGLMTSLVAHVPDEVVWNNVPADLVLFHSGRGTYHALDAVASEVWRTIAECGALEDVVDRLTRRYAADRARVAGDVAEFVDRASRLGLLALEPSESV